MGAILSLNGRTLAIYKQPVPEKEYHLMLVMLPNGQIKTQGIALEGHQVSEIGCLPQMMMDRLQREMCWTRDMIVFHCYSFDDVERIPTNLTSTVPVLTPVPTERPVSSQPAYVPSTPVVQPAPIPTPPPQPAPTYQAPPQPAAPQPAPAAPEEPQPTVLRRGQRLQVRFGDRSWHAVYWGKDDQGQVIAHKTNRDWSLMHLDLDRFSTDLMFDPVVDYAVISEIEACLTKN
jgi:hypothetical protein